MPSVIGVTLGGRETTPSGDRDERNPDQPRDRETVTVPGSRRPGPRRSERGLGARREARADAGLRRPLSPNRSRRRNVGFRRTEHYRPRASGPDARARVRSPFRDGSGIIGALDANCELPPSSTASLNTQVCRGNATVEDACHAEGRGFESLQPLSKSLQIDGFCGTRTYWRARKGSVGRGCKLRRFIARSDAVGHGPGASFGNGSENAGQVRTIVRAGGGCGPARGTG